MAKSLIKNVDGIGIWVADTAVEQFGMREIAGIIIGFLITISLVATVYMTKHNDIIYLTVVMLCIGTIIVSLILVSGGMVGILFRLEPAYEVYPGSDINNSILIHKTTNEKADQIAICKAAKEIESRCHEIAAKRAELDRIAAGCK